MMTAANRMYHCWRLFARWAWTGCGFSARWRLLAKLIELGYRDDRGGQIRGTPEVYLPEQVRIGNGIREWASWT